MKINVINNMDILFLGIIIFLFILAVFDLSVGVSNDAVNFINSALGSKAAAFKTIITVAAIGVFIGAASSNGMMDIARHGIFRPEYFSFYDLICIFMAVMVTDIILLDVFNSLGMPTSTTVSMVFELLGAAFIVSLIKMWGDDSALSLMDLINTEKALSMILGIFLSVAIAFFFGAVVQFIARAIFSFDIKSHLKWKIGIYGGIVTTAIIYFLLLKGAKDLVWMTPTVKEWLNSHTTMILTVCLIAFTLIMQLLHMLRVNVLKVIVLIGTFALAMAFAGNDLVNFIGVPLSGFSSYQDYIANGSGDPHGFYMDSLNESADTPLYFLIGAGIIMVLALATSKKARNVSKTEIGLGSQNGGDEMFGSSRIGRRVVRTSIAIVSWIGRHIPLKVRNWFNNRFDTTKMTVEQGASFDLIRGSVNLMLAGMLIAAGTSMKLPLSTTFVTFMVAMGSSLADRAWGRESAVFRITGVISVIGGWFITAGVAFIGAALIAALMYWGGTMVMIVVALAAMIIIVRSNIKFKEQNESERGDTLFQTILSTEDREQTWGLLKIYVIEHQKKFLEFAEDKYALITKAFIDDDVKALCKADRALYKEKAMLKNIRRKETVGLRRIPVETAIENSTWFHTINNSCISINYSLRRITETCKEHVENNFHPLPAPLCDLLYPIRKEVSMLITEAINLIGSDDVRSVAILRSKCDRLKDTISEQTHAIYSHISECTNDTLTVTYVYLNLLQESQEIVSSLRKLLRASVKFNNGPVNVRHFNVTPSPSIANS